MRSARPQGAAEHKFAAPSRLRVRNRCGGDPERSPPRVLLAREPGTSTNPEIVREEIDEGKDDEEDGRAAPGEAAGAGPGGGARPAGAGGPLVAGADPPRDAGRAHGRMPEPFGDGGADGDPRADDAAAARAAEPPARHDGARRALPGVARRLALRAAPGGARGGATQGARVRISAHSSGGARRQGNGAADAQPPARA